MHPHPDSSKFPPLTLQGAQKLGAALTCNGGNRTGVGGKFQLAVARVGDVNSQCERAWQQPANDARQCVFAAAPSLPGGQGGVRAEDMLEGLRVTHHDG